MRRICILSIVLAVALHPESASALTCSKWSTYEVSDDQVVYRFNSRDGRSATNVTNLDARTFRRIAPPSAMGTCLAGYAVDAEHAVYEGELIPGADIASLEVLGGPGSVYAKDKRRIYGEGKPISIAVDTFRIEPIGYGTDGNAGFWGARQLAGNGFVALKRYAKTDAAVFLNGEVVADVDPRTFEELPQRPSYARDARNVVFNGVRIDGAHPASFEIVAGAVGHARDRHRVYYQGQPIPDADPATIVQIQGHYFRDRRAVYVDGKEIPGADPTTFRVVGFGIYAVDGKRVYRFGVIVPGRDAPSFEVLQPFYTKDKNGVYFDDKPMTVADPQTFRASAMNRADDRWYRYYAERPFCKHDATAPGSLALCQ